MSREIGSLVALFGTEPQWSISSKPGPVADRDDSDVLSPGVFQADPRLTGNEYQRAWLGVVLVEVRGDDLRCPALSTKKNSMVLPRHIQLVDSPCRPVETGSQLGHWENLCSRKSTISVMGGVVRRRSTPEVLSNASPQGGAMNRMSSLSDATEMLANPER